MSEIINPATHEHRTAAVGGRLVCLDCHQALITPRLNFSDFETTLNGQAPELWWDTLKSLGPMRLDLWLIEVSFRFDVDWPDYIEILANAYGGENPPHLNDSTLGVVE